VKENNTKQKVVDTASSLFYQKGFHGTSVRDIAERAMVNVSLISYYFKSKQGLLEFAVTNYYDVYIDMMEKTIQANKSLSDIEKCSLLITKILQYKVDQFQLTAFINRELSLDSTFVREMTVTYLAKENHLLSRIFYAAIHEENNRQKTFLYMQLKGMLMSPFMLKNEWNNQILVKSDAENFIRGYVKTINKWLLFLTS
jgi:AcrR family transcriptional regulator